MPLFRECSGTRLTRHLKKRGVKGYQCFTTQTQCMRCRESFSLASLITTYEKVKSWASCPSFNHMLHIRSICGWPIRIASSACALPHPLRAGVASFRSVILGSDLRSRPTICRWTETQLWWSLINFNLIDDKCKSLTPRCWEIIEWRSKARTNLKANFSP